jgi:hypothetical protein
MSIAFVGSLLQEVASAVPEQPICRWNTYVHEQRIKMSGRGWLLPSSFVDCLVLLTRHRERLFREHVTTVSLNMATDQVLLPY